MTLSRPVTRGAGSQDRIIKQHRDIAMAPLTCQRLLGAGLTMAVKFHDDQNYTNAYYAQVCGLELLDRWGRFGGPVGGR